MYVDGEVAEESSVSGSAYCNDVPSAMSTVLATNPDIFVSR